MPRAKLRTAELRQRVVDVAVDTLAHDGLTGFTTRRVAEGAATSLPAVYELFGDKAGLVRAVHAEGFQLLHRRLVDPPPPPDPRAALRATIEALRDFVRRNPVLAEVMFSRPFADFDPGPEHLAAGAAVRELVVDRVRRCVETGVVDGNPTDVAHVVLALAQGLAAQETAGWLGTSASSRDRRWALAVDVLLSGLGHPAAGRRGPRSARPTAVGSRTARR